MIETEGKFVSVSGHSVDVLSEFIGITACVRDFLMKMHGHELADNLIGLCGKVAVYINEHDGLPPDDHELTRQFQDALGRCYRKEGKNE